MYKRQASEAGKPAAIDFIEVTGNVENAFTASVADFKQKAPMRKIMGCTCFGNPTDCLLYTSLPRPGRRRGRCRRAGRTPAQHAGSRNAHGRERSQLENVAAAHRA